VTGQTVDMFAYFNNDWQGYAITNAQTLRAFVTDAPSTSLLDRIGVEARLNSG
jgi:hypothetical protein